MPKASFNFPVLLIDNLRGGRNGTDPPATIPDLQVAEAKNIDWTRSTVGGKRSGSVSVPDPRQNLALTLVAPLTFLARFIPSGDETAAEVWTREFQIFSATPWSRYIYRLRPSVAVWEIIDSSNAADTINSPIIDHVTFNGKFFLTFASAPNRLHVHDPADGTNTWRRVGLVQSAAATTGALAAGAVTDTRTYKVCWTRQVGGVTVRRGERSVATAAVVMAAQQVPVTRPTLPAEGETHWELYAASTNGLYVLIATTATGTATVNDNNASLTTFAGTAIPLEGINLTFPSVRYLSTDGNRLLGASDSDLTNVSLLNRVYWTPVIHDNDVGDDERYVSNTTQKNYLDVNPNDGGRITALSLPLQGNIYVFKQRQIYKLTPTGDVTAPYQSTQITPTIGCVAHRTLSLGEDAAGNPALYFCSYVGPYRLGVNGLEYLGRDIEDIWTALNLTKADAFHAVFYPQLKQYWIWVIRSASYNYPDTILVFNAARAASTEIGTRGGWAIYTGRFAEATDSMIFAEGFTYGSASAGPKHVPWVIISGEHNALTIGILALSSTALADVDLTGLSKNAYQGLLTSKVYSPAGENAKFRVRAPVIHAKGRSVSTSLALTLLRDYGAESVSATVDLNTSQARIILPFERGLADCTALQLQIGDAAAIEDSGATGTAWEIDKIIVPYETEGEAGGF